MAAAGLLPVDRPMSMSLVDRGMRSAVSIAILYPGVTPGSPLVARYMNKHGIHPWDLPPPSIKNVELAKSRTDGKSKTLEEWWSEVNKLKTVHNEAQSRAELRALEEAEIAAAATRERVPFPT